MPCIRIADVAVSSVDFGAEQSASADVVLTSIERGLEVMRAMRACIKSLQASGSGTDLTTTIALLLVELGGYDCALLWRVDNSVLTPVAAAFAHGAAPAPGELGRLSSHPPRLEEVGLEDNALGGLDRAAASSLGSGGPLEAILGSLSYALAAVRCGAGPPFVLQAICRNRCTNEADRALVLAFAELTAALITEPGATELLNRCRGWAGPASPRHAHDHAAVLHAVLADEPIAKATPSGGPADEVAEAPTPAELETLTPREREVLAHALTGASYVEIADRLFVSLATLHTHMQSILRKLGLHSRVQLVARYATPESRDQAAS